MKSNYKLLGDYITRVDIRNRNLETTNLKGLSMTKEFRDSTSNIVGVDLSKYKLVPKNHFACDFMSVIRVHRLPVVHQNSDDLIIVSPAYTVFKVIDETILNPEYLMMWFRRPEFDRYADFRCDSAIRGGFKWDELGEVELPIPSIEKQNEIVAEYNTIVNRIKLNENLNQKLEETAQALYKHWFVDFEFPNAEGKPYKSSGGEMVYNEELDLEIPLGWEIGVIGDMFTFQRGHDLPSRLRIKGKYPIFASTGIAEYHNKFKFDKPTIITGRSGSLGELFYYDKPCWPLNTSLYIKKFKKATPFYSLYFLRTINLKELGAGSAVPTLNRNDIHEISKEIPNEDILEFFENKIASIQSFKVLNSNINSKLEVLLNLLLSKMSRLETKTEVV
ncbi:restriction endonuclease subunit S [Psychroserpens damuponensis]|uniref:restriction endonuclease subunit S n=1 Tax=Psychroserpens damuponensis TaxID=943936 RepID=UPI0005912E85|nr:restriction endonuclease subunit S [Psychroserpens damuponensis]